MIINEYCILLSLVSALQKDIIHGVLCKRDSVASGPLATAKLLVSVARARAGAVVVAVRVAASLGLYLRSGVCDLCPLLLSLLLLPVLEV